MNENETPEAKWSRISSGTSIVSIKLFTAMYGHPYIQISEECQLSGRVIKNIDEVDYMVGGRLQPTKSHYLQWADSLEYYAKWCREKAEDVPKK